MGQMTPEVVSTTDLNAILGQTKFLAGFGFVVDSCEPGECNLLVPFRSEFERPGDIISGMTIMGAADVAMWLAIMTMRGAVEQWVTSDMKTAFLKPAMQESIVCNARVLKLSRRTAYGIVETTGASGELVAHHVLTYIKVSDPN